MDFLLIISLSITGVCLAIFLGYKLANKLIDNIIRKKIAIHTEKDKAKKLLEFDEKQFLSEEIRDNVQPAQKEIRKTFDIVMQIRLIAHAVDLGVFSPYEIRTLLGMDFPAVKKLLENGVELGIFEDLSNTGEMYKVNLERVQSFLSQIDNVKKAIVDSISNNDELLVEDIFVLAYDKELFRNLFMLGLKSLSVILFDPDIGLILKAFINRTAFIKRLLKNPAFVTELGIAGKSAEFIKLSSQATNLSNDVFLIMKKFEYGERHGDSFVVIETIERSDKEKLTMFASQLADKLNGIQQISKDILEKIISDTVKSFLNSQGKI